MKPGLALCALILCGLGFLEPTHASDWGESSEVRARLDRLKARPQKASQVYLVDAFPEQAINSPQTTARPWRNLSYETIAPTVIPKQSVHGRSINVAEADKLGYQLNNADMRKKVLELYRRPDIVVEQYVIGQ